MTKFRFPSLPIDAGGGRRKTRINQLVVDLACCAPHCFCAANLLAWNRHAQYGEITGG